MLLRATNVSFLTIEGGPGSELRMFKPEYMANTKRYPKSEDRMGIALFGVRDFVLRNLTVVESGGDGLYLSDAVRGSVTNLKLLRNYR